MPSPRPGRRAASGAANRDGSSVCRIVQQPPGNSATIGAEAGVGAGPPWWARDYRPPPARRDRDGWRGQAGPDRSVAELVRGFRSLRLWKRCLLAGSCCATVWLNTSLGALESVVPKEGTHRAKCTIAMLHELQEASLTCCKLPGCRRIHWLCLFLMRLLSAT